MVLEEWERPPLHMMVILLGLGGMGKTTIVEVVFSLGEIEECKHDEVIHFNIVELQKLMLKDLMRA